MTPRKGSPLSIGRLAFRVDVYAIVSEIVRTPPARFKWIDRRSRATHRGATRRAQEGTGRTRPGADADSLHRGSELGGGCGQSRPGAHGVLATGRNKPQLGLQHTLDRRELMDERPSNLFTHWRHHVGGDAAGASANGCKQLAAFLCWQYLRF